MYPDALRKHAVQVESAILLKHDQNCNSQVFSKPRVAAAALFASDEWRANMNVVGATKLSIAALQTTRLFYLIS